ncbi:unnamed protein product [Ilex paraguariensis]|uniref:Uncharacterized protein n=1 Tax=Ilex paraguariensis TaxID=185542 RepID=A0ABC8R5J2_9AQUA
MAIRWIDLDAPSSISKEDGSITIFIDLELLELISAYNPTPTTEYRVLEPEDNLAEQKIPKSSTGKADEESSSTTRKLVRKFTRKVSKTIPAN